MNLFRCIQSSWCGVKNYLIVLLFLVFGQNVFAQTSYPNSETDYLCNGDNNTLTRDFGNERQGYWTAIQGYGKFQNPNSHKNVVINNIGFGKNVFYYYDLNDYSDPGQGYFLEHIITVYNNKVSVANHDTTVCDLSPTITINGTDPNGYGIGKWTANPADVSITNSSAYSTTVTNMTKKTRTFTWTISNMPPWGNCSTQSADFTVTIATPPTVNAGNDQTICAGSSASLNAGGTAANYSWDNGIGSVNPVTVYPALTTTYTVTGTDATGNCSATDAVTITVNPEPALFSVSGSGSYCQGTGGLPVTLSGSENGVTYTLSDGSAMAGTGNPITWNGKTAGNYTVSAKKGNCNRVMTGTANITEVASPIVYTFSGPAYLCQGSSVILKLSGSQVNVSYALKKDGTIIGTYAGTGSAMNWSVSGIGTYTVTASTTGSTICSSEMNGTVNLTEKPLPVPVTSGDVAICAGNSTQLTSSGGTSYSWSPATGLSDVNMSNPVANPANTTKYTVTATDSYGCSGSSSLTVTVNALPPTNAGKDISICTGDVVTLTATGADTYNWDGLGSSNPVTVSPTTTTTYTVTGTRNGCTKSDQVTVTVNARPTANAGSDVSLCKGTSTILTASGGGSYKWNNGQTTQSIMVSPKSTSTYTVTVTDGNGCTDNDDVLVTVLDTAILTVSPDVAICNGASTVLNASATGGNGSNTISWNPGGTSPSITVTPSNTTLSPEVYLYSVTATDTKGCKASGQVKVTVNPLPVVSMNNLDATYCADEKNIKITGIPTSNAGKFTFSEPVSSSGFADNGDGTAMLNPVGLTPATNYSILYTYTDGNGCTSSVSKGFYVRNELTPKPVLSGLLPMYCDNDANKFTINASPASVTNGVYSSLPSDFTDHTNGVATFTPSVMGIGSYRVEYTYTDPGTGCVGSVDSTFIVGVPVAINIQPSYCKTQGKILLSVTKPASVTEKGTFYIDGVYSGVEGSATFDPSTADVGSHTIEYKLTNAISCTDVIKTTVTVNDLPDASFTIGGISNKNTNISFCENDALLTLSGKNPGGTFSSPDAGVSGNKYDPKIAGVGIHTVYYEYTDINGCTNTESATFEIKSVPAVSINNLDPAYCNDHAMVDLIGNPLQVGTLPYGVWTAPNGWTSDMLKDNNNGHADFYPSKVPTAGTYTIKYTVVGPTGCSATAAQNVVINFVPSVDFANLPSEICENNGPVTLTGSPTSSLGTFSGDGIISQNNGKAVFDPIGLSTISHDITYSYADNNGCSASKTRSTVVKQPPAVFEVTGGGAYCSDAISGPVGLSGSENNINYQLYLNGQTKGSPVSGTGNTLDFGSQNAVGTYTVVASSPSNLCSTQMNGNAVITSITPPANFALSPSSSAYCEGSSGVSLTLSASENNVVYTLKEISSGTPKVIGSLNGNVSGGSLVWNNILEGKYIVEAARGACVKEMNGSVAVTIIKNKLFAVTATSDAGANPICQGTSTVLHASAEAGTTVKSYSWSATSGGGLTNTNIANPTASPSNSSTYTVVITDANGCSSSGQVDVQVNAKPTAAINYQNVICEGTSTTLVATGGVASGSNTGYLWNTGATADVIAVSPSTTTAYSVTVTNSYGCTDSRTVMLTVRPKPGVDAGIDQVICAGEKATLHATTGVSGVVSDGYTWSTGETTSSIDVSPATTTDYTVTASKNYPSSVVLPDNIILPAIECTASDVVNVKVNQLPSVSFTDPSTDICYNASPITLDGKVTPAGTLGGSGVYTSPTAQAAISGADQFDPSKATVGSHTIIYTYNENVGNSKTCSASASKIIVVEQITAITSQPSDVATCEGTKASFLVAATGDGLTYQWYKGTKKLSDGGNISGSATTNLILQNVTTSDAGVYSCAISGSCGSVTSNAANLTVNEPIVANGQPVASQTLCEGATATFTYPVGGSNLVYQWKKGSTVLTDGGTISGAKTGTLTISGLSLSDAGTYTCEVSGSCGSTVHSDPSNLIVDEHISITTQPLGQSACLGDTRYFSVAATGSNLLYQWQKDGVALTDGANISGSNDKVLVLSSVKASDAGTYNCIITNSCGSLSSNHVDLTINTPVSITSASGDATKCEGDNVNFVVSATGSNLSYQWQYNNTNLSDGGNISGTQTNNLFIQSMTKANAGVYSCIVTGSCGNQVSNSAILRVNEKILITSQPQNTATCLGNNTAFSVSATGSNLSYQWQKDGSGLIAGATNPALTLSNVSASDAGMYSCIVSGSCGSVTSNSASLTVQAPVAITGQPASVEYCEGKNVNFVVSATGTDLTYQWTKDGLTLTDGTKINGSTTNTLTINNIDLIDKGAYTCKVTGTCSYVNSTPANLTVDPTTAIITQPVDFYAVTSGNATFSVTASGAYAYQWQKDGVNLSDGGVYSGVNKPILSLTNVTSANAGSYRCIVTGNCGTVNSNPGYLTVNLTNLITTQPAGPVVKCAGESANFDVVAQGTNITYQWRKDGVVLSDNAQITGSKTADLSIKNVVESNSGNYSCLVTADEGTQTSMPASLTVNALTDVTLQPLDAVKCVGDQAVFTIQAKGSNLTYQWIKRVNGTDTNLSDGGTISGATTAELTINKVVAGDAGVYICHVSGDCGNDNSNSATLTVNQNTKINTQPVSQSKCSGTTVTFAVSADGSNLKYQWKKNGTAITDGTNVAGATTATLTLSNLALADAGPYTCDMTGSCSQETSSPAILSVTQSPAVTIQPQPVVKCEGDHVVFAVTATGAKSYQWTKDNVALSDNTNISGSTTDILSIAAATASDAGSYQCTVTGNSSCGVALSDATTLTINQKAKILTDPVGAARCEGSSVTFSVTASGTSLTYQWKKDGANLSDGANISGTSAKDLNLTNLAQSDAGIYSCVVTGPCTSVTSAMATLKVNPATKISIQPLSKEVVIGQSASFAINATGTNLKYLWEKDGTSLSDGSTIQGSLTNKLTITSTATADAGSYRCVVTGDCGIVDSDPATLSIDLKTAITSQPSGITLCQGNAVVLSLTANGTALTYQWKKDGTVLTDVSGVMSGSTGPVLTIQHAQTSDAGAYTCVVTGAGGSVTSDVAQVVVNPSASISAQPLSVTVCKGTDASFVISASGASTYQWYKDGTLLSDGGTVSGSQTNYLYLHNVTDADAGTYYCKAAGSCTTATSNTAALTVNDPVEITSQPVASQSRCEGDKAIFSFGVTGTNVTYQWKKDGSAIGNGGRISGANTANLTVSGLTTADAGNYICVVGGSCGNIINSDPSTLLVNEPVVITTQPVNQSACVGDNKYFSVTATGSNLQYQWKKNGININGATTNQLVLSPVAVTDAGTYSCVLSNSCGDISTDAVQLTVNSSTVITSSPANAVKCLGENASFKVAATGSNLAYQWLFNGNNLTDGGTLSGASTDNLFISSVSASNAGNYSCLVSGSCGTELSTSATLTVNQPVTISIQPQNQEICAGQNTYFSVTAAGTITSYQWQKDGVAISGANGSTLLLNNITSADAGKYSCVITGTGDCAAVTSTEANLTIDAPVAITTQPSSVTKCEGTNASFTVVASGTNLTYQWSKDGVAMTDNSRINGSVSNTLVINNIVAADKAAYTCLVTGSCGNINSTPANLTVDPKTTVISQPVDFYAVVSGNATFSVTTSGASSYQWQKDGTNLTDGGVYSGVNTSILSLNNITTAEAGSFRCVVTGSCGTVNSNAAYLTVGSTKIVITQPVSPIVKCTGESANFDVVAQGTNLTYQWQKDGENLNDDAQVSGSHTANLSIANLTTSNSGNYSCLVSAKEGKENSLHSILTVNDLPDVTVQPQDASRCEGDQVVFAIQAKGSSLTYQWVKRVNTTDTNLTDGGTISGSNTAKLTISKVALSDAAVYYCHITGDCGTDNSNPAALKVNENTKITVQPVSQTECAGASAVFGVSAVGSNLTYQWKKDGIAISDGTDVLGSTTATLTLSKLMPGDAIPYTCDVTGTCGDETSSSVLLTVKDVSAFTTQPVSASKCEGDVASFTVAAAGAKTYQWSKDGNTLTDLSGKISGSATDHLVINSLVAGDAGTYQCAVTGDCGNALSTAVSLTVSQNAKIIDEPVSASKCNGESVLFSVNASGTALTYQWKKNGADLTDGTNIAGSQTKNLNISNLTDTDAGTYDCVISSPCTTVTTSLVTLAVKTSPMIDIQPLSTSVKTGTPFTVTINATGTNLKYQWQKDGTNLSDGTHLQGSSTNILTVVNSDSTDAGSYRCVVNGDCGVATSDPAVIQIIEETKITNQSATQVLCEGNILNLFVTAKGTDLTYIWKKNGSVLSDITGKLSGSHTANLTIQAIDSTDKAVYSCVVSGKGGTVTSNLIQLNVNNNTVITSQPLSTITSCEGTNVVMNISASSAQTYQWYKGNNIVSNSVNITGATTNTLNINSVTLSDAGSYYCKVTGLCGEVISNPSALIVNGNPVTPGTITGQSQVCQGSTLIDYQVPSITYATDYEWTIPMNARIVSGDHTSHIQVLFPLNSATGAQIIKVRGKNSCTSGPWSADFKVSINTPPNSYAGLDQNICDVTTTLQGSKIPSGGTGEWNLISGSLYFADKTSNTSTITSVAQGDNVLSWTVTLNGCSTTDTVRIRNNQLTVDAGLDKTTCSSTVTMDGSIVPSGANGSWYVVSGNGTFNSSSSSNAVISGLGFGINKFSWVVTQNGCISRDTVTVYNNIPDTPLAGNDQNVCSTVTVLNANKATHGTGRWTVFSGSGYFDNATDQATHIRSLARGKNILTWTITNQNCSLTDTVVVSNNLPESNAGSDQVLCDSRSTLAANPPLTGNKGQWSVASGSATFLDYSSYNSQVAGLNKGSNKLIWSILSGICVSTDTVELINNAPTNAYAGPDQSVIGSTTTLAANSPLVGTGKWTVISGSAGFANDTLCSTKVVGLDPGINELRWTISNKGCSTYSEVMITNGAVEAVEAGDDQTVCANTTQLKATQPQYGFGVWTVKKGSAKFTNNQLFNTQVTNLAPGKNILTWTVSLNGVSFSDTVTITNNQPTTSVVGKQIYICSDSTILTGNNPVYGNGKWTLEGGSAVIANDKVYNSKVTHLGYGDNLFRWTITNGTCISSSILTITNNNPTPAEAGPDMTICSDSTQLIPNNPSIGVGEWSVLKGSGNFTGNIVQGLSVGTNVLRWSIKNATCVSTDDVVVISNKPTTANAGTQAIICTDSMYLTANKPNSLIGEYGRWTVLNGAGTFADSTSSTSLVRDLALGVNNLRWTITNKTCSSSSDVAINYSSVKAIAGSDITSCDNHVYLNANNPGSGTGEWSVVGGSGSAHFVNSSSPNTQVTNLDYGVNTLRWTITNKGCASYSEVKVTNDAPSTSYAGGNRNVCDNSVALAATPVVIGRGTWSVLSGSGTFSDSHASNTNVSNIGSGINTYRWTVTNNLCSSTSEVVVNNGKPIYTSAGIDQTLCADSTALAANSPQLGKGVWRIIRGAGILDDVYNPTSVIRSLGPDTTILRWTVTNNQCVDYQEVKLVNNLPTVAAAGANQTICADKTTLDGNAPLIGYGVWTVISGSGSFANDKLYNTVVQNLSRGPNILRWTISKHECSFTSDVTIRNDMPTLPDAGIDLAVCGNSAMLNGTKPAVGKGRWTVVSGGGVFSDSSKYNTQVTGLVQGNNVFRWTITNNQCVFSDTMLVKDNQADVYAGPDQIIYVDNAKLAGNKPIRGAGIWSLDAGAGTIVSPGTYETNVTGLGEGVNTFKWSIDIDGCISSSSVKVSYYRKPVPVFSASTEEGCAPLTVKLTNTTIGNYPFQWSLGESGIISADASPVYTYTTPGTYTVKLMVTGPDGQLVTAIKTITVHPVPKAKFDVVTKDLYIPGDELRCYNTSEGAESWLWDFGDGTSSADFNGVHTYADSGVYNIKLVASSSYLCRDSVTITNAVHVIERSLIKFPSAFTPNPNGSSNGRYNRNDYSNDVFYPIVIMNGIQDYHMEIYNRWGVLVFESNDIDIGWDGYYKGKLLTQDVYIYRVSGFYNNGKRFSFVGDVLLMRK